MLHPNRRVSLMCYALILVMARLLSIEWPLTAAPIGFRHETLISGLNQATHLAFLPDGTMLIVERAGVIKKVLPGTSIVQRDPFLALTNVNSSEVERGMTSLLIDPEFATNRYVYVYYTANNPLRNRLSRFTATNSTSASPASEVVLWEDITEAGVFHQGGAMLFGPDGKLYVGIGDNYSAEDAPRLTSYHGKILRLNKDGSIPTDNPFYDGAGPNLDAIYARGVRNPYRMTLDPATRHIYIGDVGGSEGDSYEEINVLQPGRTMAGPPAKVHAAILRLPTPGFHILTMGAMPPSF